MRPIQLSMQAFGPFAGRESIDFSCFPERAPFTISGPTGAGKTTILDALCLALFGETSGGERDAADTRSQHAERDVPTEVRLVFALGADTWRVTRRPARRGEGGEGQSVLLERQVGADQWQRHTQRITEANEKIRDLLGFDVKQFRQVVVLPQGAFRQLLTANSTQREAILKQLFGTHLYERIQKGLNEQADQLDSQFKLLAAKRQGLLSAQGVETLAELTQKLAQATEHAAAARAQTGTASQNRQAADQALRAGQQAAQRLHERAVSAQKLADHQALATQQRQREDRVAAAQKAQAAEPPVQLAVAAAEQLNRASKQVDAARAACHRLQPLLESAEQTLLAQRERTGERERLLGRVAQLEKLAGKVDGLAAARGRANQLQREHEVAKAAARSGQAHAKQLGEELPKAQAEYLRLRTQAAGLAGQQAVVEKLNRVKKLRGEVQAAGEVVRKQQELTQASTARRDAAAGGAQAALDAYEACHRAWLQGQAARLALELKHGQACPVCGSREHPAPAHSSGPLPTDQDLDQTKRRYEQARTAVEQLAREVVEVQARQAAAQEVLLRAQATLADEALPPDQATDEALRQAQTAVAQAVAADKHLPAVQSRAEALQAELDLARNHAAELETAAADLATHAAAAQQAVVALEADLPEELRTPAQLQAAHAECQRGAKAIQEAVEAAEQQAAQLRAQLAAAMGNLDAQVAAQAEAQTGASTAASQRDAALRAQGFATLEDWQGARRAPAELADLQANIEAWRTRLHELRGLAEQAASLAVEIVEPDLEGLQAAAEAAQLADVAAQRELATWDGALQQLHGTQKLLADLASQSGDLEAHYAVVKQLASACNGDNPKGLPLQRFVLAGLLDDVLRAANVRLHDMTRGRYALLRKEEITDRRRTFGLDLEVLDAYTGQQRPATTLSGGEGFLASLALALGLSDVVQGYSGGIRLDALFIDEGFGSLDPEALELAIQALVDLTSGRDAAGRLVGVISHVPEMKARLAKGIEVEVRSDGKGSRVRMVA